MKLDFPQTLIEHFYPDDSPLRRLLIRHSTQVRTKALEILDSPLCAGLKLDRELVSAGAMLHDIGIGRCDARGILCEGTAPYIAHGIIGAKMLREYGKAQGIDLERYARICERHTGSGIAAQEIRAQALPLPERDYLPESDEEKLICLADKFFSKSGDMREKPLARARASVAKFEADSAARFDAMCRRFGLGRDIPGDFVYVADAVPDAVIDLKYFTGDNFMGRRADGYEAPKPSLTAQAADALKQAADELRSLGYRIVVFDAFRPARAVADFVRWCEDESDPGNPAHYPRVPKNEFFRRGYLAARSTHSRGSAIDLGLIGADGKETDMGGMFDLFDPVSHPDYTGLSPEQLKNREILAQAMFRAGFKPMSTEWWHFTLKNEPYPDTYFDFPVR